MAVLETMAYELARAALAQQESSLSELRSRTGTLLSVSSIATSFLGARAIEQSGLKLLTVLALSAFVLSVLLSVYALMPRRNLTFAIGGRAVHERLGGREPAERMLLLSLTEWLDGIRDDNQRLVARVTAAFSAASGLVAAEIVFFGLALAVT